jgi:hypothetical protein
MSESISIGAGLTGWLDPRKTRSAAAADLTCFRRRMISFLVILDGQKTCL